MQFKQFIAISGNIRGRVKIRPFFLFYSINNMSKPFPSHSFTTKRTAKSTRSFKPKVWGSDNICIKEKKKFGGKNLA